MDYGKRISVITNQLISRLLIEYADTENKQAQAQLPHVLSYILCYGAVLVSLLVEVLRLSSLQHHTSCFH